MKIMQWERLQQQRSTLISRFYLPLYRAPAFCSTDLERFKAVALRATLPSTEYAIVSLEFNVFQFNFGQMFFVEVRIIRRGLATFRDSSTSTTRYRTGTSYQVDSIIILIDSYQKQSCILSPNIHNGPAGHHFRLWRWRHTSFGRFMRAFQNWRLFALFVVVGLWFLGTWIIARGGG